MIDKVLSVVAFGASAFVFWSVLAVVGAGGVDWPVMPLLPRAALVGALVVAGLVGLLVAVSGANGRDDERGA